MRNRKRKLFSRSGFESLAMPVIIVCGLLAGANGVYLQIRNQRRCDEIAASRGYKEAKLFPGNRITSNECLCRGQRRADGTWDMTVTEVVSVYDAP